MSTIDFCDLYKWFYVNAAFHVKFMGWHKFYIIFNADQFASSHSLQSLLRYEI